MNQSLTVNYFDTIKVVLNRIVNSKMFEHFIMLSIIINSVLIGLETSYTHDSISQIQNIILVIFTVEVFIRFYGKASYSSYIKDIWNWIDVALVTLSYMPDEVFSDSSLLVVRVLRVFRVLRLIKAFPDVRLMASVLVKSISALFFNAIFLFIFMYLFSIIGLTLFKLPDAATASIELQAQLAQYLEVAPHTPTLSPDPYGTLSETWFTLFRILTGEDWTDLRYNLMIASDMGVIQPSHFVITAYHTLWFMLSAFLLMNLLVGAILNNYQIVMDEQKTKP